MSGDKTADKMVLKDAFMKLMENIGKIKENDIRGYQVVIYSEQVDNPLITDRHQ